MISTQKVSNFNDINTQQDSYVPRNLQNMIIRKKKKKPGFAGHVQEIQKKVWDETL